MTPIQKNLTGGCQCGAVRYQISTPPHEVYICHCTECRRQSSSAFGISVISVHTSLELVKGEPRCWSRPTASGGVLDCFFCSECGTRIWHQGRDDDVVSIKGGSLDHAIDVSDSSHIWTRSKLSGIVIPDHVRQCPVEPE
ncbi:MAG: GFA family protein [Geminicoccaceae bacterium]